jgi:hypothetical protein
MTEAKGPRGYVNEDQVISSITLIYWTLLLKRYVQLGNAKNDNKAFRHVVQNAQSTARGIIRDDNDRKDYLKAIDAIVAGGGTIPVVHHVVHQPTQKQTTAAPDTGTAWAALAVTPQFKSLLTRLSTDDKSDAAKVAQAMLLDGSTPDQIYKELYSLFQAISESSDIFKGIIQTLIA